MSFTSFYFFVFLLLVLVGYRYLPGRISKWFLIGSSYLFYGAFQPWYCILPLISTLIDFVAAKRIGTTGDRGIRKKWLLFSVLGNLAILGFFKYADFAILNTNLLTRSFGLPEMAFFEFLLPIGISFYTFQTMSYTIDVYRGKHQVENDLTTFALYVVFFPQLVAGPIERAKNLIPQLASKQPVTREDFEYGVQRILWGLVKKLVFADRLGLMVNPVFSDPSRYSAAELLIAAFCFTFQLYLDFSAYCDIAIGSARLMGIRLSENFNYPFLATSPSNFWSRWHITLTTWFRDYVYAPMGGTQISRPLATAFRAILVLTLVGLWHGPSWNFVFFGLLGGLTVALQMLYRISFRKKIRTRAHKPNTWYRVLAHFPSMLVIASIMIFFRSPELSTAFEMFNGIVSGNWTLSDKWIPSTILLIFVWVMHVLRGMRKSRQPINLRPAARGGFWACLMMLLLYGTVEQGDLFIYYRF